MAYGDSQGRGLIGTVAAGLRYGHGNARSEPYLLLMLQLVAKPGALQPFWLKLDYVAPYAASISSRDITRVGCVF